MNPINTIINVIDNKEYETFERPENTWVTYKGYDVGSMFKTGEYKNKYSLSFIPNSPLEQWLSTNYKIEKSWNDSHHIVWFDLNDDKKIMELKSIFENVIPRVEEHSLRTRYQRHEME